MDRNEQREEIKLKLAYANLFLSLGVIASLIFAGLQWRESSKAATETSYQRIVDLWHDHLKIFIEKPQLRPYFEEGRKLAEDDPESQAILAFADVRLDAMDAVLTFGEFWFGLPAIKGWRTTFENAFRTSPVLCQRFAKTKSNYGLIVPIGNSICSSN
jgi:hypothetical protein